MSEFASHQHIRTIWINRFVMGLGLSIAKAHGGATWVDPPGYDGTPFPGSSFHVLLSQCDQAPDDHKANLFTAHTSPRIV